MFKVKPEKIKYTDTTSLPSDYTDKMNKEYSRMAKLYDALITIFPLWKKWLKKVIPHIQGDKILEVSFGSGYLMSQYATQKYEIYGIDYNEKMLEITQAKMDKLKIGANLRLGNVESLPYPDNTFDTVINTMAFTGYPDGKRAMSELNRGYWCVKLMEKSGDVIKDIYSVLVNNGFDCEINTIGGFGSVHLFLAEKKKEARIKKNNE